MLGQRKKVNQKRTEERLESNKNEFNLEKDADLSSDSLVISDELGKTPIETVYGISGKWSQTHFPLPPFFLNVFLEEDLLLFIYLIEITSL